MKFELERWQVWWIALSYSIALAGLAFDLDLLRGVGLGALGMQLLIVSFTARQ